MLYKEAGQFHSSYAQYSRLLPLREDRIGMAILLVFGFLVVPFIANEYWLAAILVPWLCMSLVALGQNILMGYAGQLSLGSAGFMAAGAFACYNLVLRVDGIGFIPAMLLSGLIAAAIGMVFGLTSLRVRGLYLMVATLASQFFIIWALNKIQWFTNYDPAGVITAQHIFVLGYEFDTPVERYLVVAGIVTVLTLLAAKMAHGSPGRAWMAVRDMDVAAEVNGLSLLRTKLQAFGISSFYCGVGGALYTYAYLETVEPSAFTIHMSFLVLFMALIGGLGTIMGAFFGAAFVLLLPIVLNVVSYELFEGAISLTVVAAMEQVLFGVAIIVILIFEPLGLARLWSVSKERLRLWPFRH